jgi:hypothetical protein
MEDGPGSVAMLETAGMALTEVGAARSSELELAIAGKVLPGASIADWSRAEDSCATTGDTLLGAVTSDCGRDDDGARLDKVGSRELGTAASTIEVETADIDEGSSEPAEEPRMTEL